MHFSFNFTCIVMFKALISFKSLAISGFLLAWVILFKLLMIGRNLNFMNIMFTIILMFEIICGSFIIPNFFKIGENNWNENVKANQELREACGIWYSSYTAMIVIFSFTNMGMFFMRWNASLILSPIFIPSGTFMFGLQQTWLLQGRNCSTFWLELACQPFVFNGSSSIQY